jgi:hypothetical protein
MGGTPNAISESSASIHGKIVEAEVKVSVDPGRPLPLVCALYAVEVEGGVWLCAYYGTNRSVFDYLPQKGATLDEAQAGVLFHVKEFLPGDRYQPAAWDEFKKSRMMTYDVHGAG